MKNNKNTLLKTANNSWLILFAITCLFLTSFGMADKNTALISNSDIDLNGDGTINILVLGTNSSINGEEAFSPDQIAVELQNILSADDAISIEVNVVSEDIHMSKPVLLGLGGGGTEYTWTHHSHSLTQYYYWPDGLEARMDNLSGNGDIDWDYVVITADPNIISTTPGFYSLGVNKIAAKVAEGNAESLLIMQWPKNETSNTSIEHYEEFTYRTADGSKVPVTTIPAGLAWDALSDEQKDVSSTHPSPNGSYLTAASIYAQLSGISAASSNYIYDNELADLAFNTVVAEENEIHYSGIRSFISPFKSCDISDDVLNYNHTGTSSENGIKGGLNWVFNQAPQTLLNGGTSPIDLNYGRANSNFEPNKRYKINPELFDFSFGFPMQDHGNHGDVSILYGIDRRQSGTMNDTDLGVARFMVENSELPYARAVPIRTLFAQMKELSPNISAYRDSWHMHRDLDKAIGAYMYTILTGGCAVGEEPMVQDSDEWRTWAAHKIGFDTAWNLMYLQAEAPACSEFVDEDGDGFFAFADCDDNNESINPSVEEIVYNGIDDDCNENTLDDDLDQDGFPLADDCDDTNPEVNSNAVEIPYNGIDDDCNENTLDDDLDQDGFPLADDCDDMNPEINPDIVEEPYNGIDDDCNEETLDDDLDLDGFLVADDCDDMNADVNPDAEEIPNNGIDEDCDGNDLISSLQELGKSTILIYPNPATELINIDVEGLSNYKICLFNLQGELIKTATNSNKLIIQALPSGTYLLEIQDLDSGQKALEQIIIDN